MRLPAAVATSVAASLVVIACSSSEGSGEGSTTRADGGSVGTPGDAGVDGGREGGAPPGADAGADGAAGADGGGDAGSDAAASALVLTSTAFVEGGAIPATHALCPNGSANVSPPLAWANAPPGTQSYAVVMRDLDVAGAGNYHWVIWDIPGASSALPQAVAAQASPPSPAGAKQTYWSFSNDYSYQGPCPPSEHRYQFTVYSFSVATLPITPGETSPNAADAVIQANKTASASLTGKYAQ